MIITPANVTSPWLWESSYSYGSDLLPGETYGTDMTEPPSELTSAVCSLPVACTPGKGACTAPARGGDTGWAQRSLAGVAGPRSASSSAAAKTWTPSWVAISWQTATPRTLLP